uniref:RNB domain-containing protein n=1 Tax=Rhabditophanes sp. KR3021 TaxID=114890 RepID=A0AC35TV17_9BILA
MTTKVMKRFNKKNFYKKNLLRDLEAQNSKESLGTEQLAMLEGLRKKSDETSKTKTGRITMKELFGGNELNAADSKMSMNTYNNPLYLDPFQILQMQILMASQKHNFNNMNFGQDFMVPQMPLPTGRLTPSGVGMHDADYAKRQAKSTSSYQKRPPSASFTRSFDRSCNTDFMNHFFPTSQAEPQKVVDKNSNKHLSNGLNSYHYEMNRNTQTSRVNTQAGYGNKGNSSFSNSKGTNPNYIKSPPGNNGKMSSRKLFFVPYMTHEQVARGIKNNALVTGTIRVNQRNYEESYIDNPEGDDQIDVLILGLHDRNRALHGDTVVVKYKERINWVVRENLYQSWRNGKLNVVVDDNGQPISIPPVNEAAAPLSEVDELLNFMPATFRSRLEKIETVEVGSEEAEHSYDRNALLSIAAGMETVRRANMANDAGLCHLNEEQCTGMRKLHISRVPHAEDGELHCPESPNSRKPQLNASGIRKTVFRTLADMAPEDWGMPDVCLQKTAEVVYIKEQRHTRMAVGQLKPLQDGNKNFALFSPSDPRMPRMMIPADQLPDKFYDNPTEYNKFVFVARLVEWGNQQFSRGKLYRPIGLTTEIDAQSKGILMSNGVEFKDFSATALSYLPFLSADQFEITSQDVASRKDYRSERTFSIDPAGSKDLDDVIHIKKNEDGSYEVGVHIADVSHFLDPKTELDEWAQRRAETVYLVDKCIPMLPSILAEELCGLSQDADRFAMSIVWNLSKDGEIVDEWIGRTIVKNKAQLSYEQANEILENPAKSFENKVMAEVKEDLLELAKLHKVINQRRKDEGYLFLPQASINFKFTPGSEAPMAVTMNKPKLAKEIVQEFMIMANICVAKKLEKSYPKLALLRRQPQPKQKILNDTVDMCSKLGYSFDGSSVKSMAAFLDELKSKPETKSTVYHVVNQLVAKPMQASQYICSGLTKGESECKHYALNVAFYAHFTSPIRRYADIMVHRLLSASLGYTAEPSMSATEMELICKKSNENRVGAKNCKNASNELYLGYLIKELGKLEQIGVVTAIQEQSFEVYFPKLGLTKRVYSNRLRLTKDPEYESTPVPSMTIQWDFSANTHNTSREEEKAAEGKPQTFDQTIKMFSPVRCVLSPTVEPFKFQTTIVPTGDSDITAMLNELNSEAVY